MPDICNIAVDRQVTATLTGADMSRRTLSLALATATLVASLVASGAAAGGTSTSDVAGGGGIGCCKL
jgi:hypothetical protein